MAPEKPKLLRSSLLLAALVTIGAGVLWHNGAIKPSLHSGLQGANLAHRRQEAPAPRPNPAEPNPNYSQDTVVIEVKAPVPEPGNHAQKEAPQERITKRHSPLEVPRTAWTGVVPSIATTAQISGPVAAAGQGPLSLPASESRLALKTGEGNEAARPSDRGEGVNAKDAVEERPDERLKQIAFPYALYLGSASAQFPERAKEGMAQYRRRGIEAYWVEVELSKGIWYRIYTGCFSSREEAERFKEEKGLHKAEVKEVPYGNLIGAYGSLKEAQAQVQVLKGQGFSPYVVEGPAGTYRVFVGAFYDEERAGRQLGELKEKGIESGIVKR